jgi:hypothetical protein
MKISQIAEDMGREAFRAGKRRVPAHDKEVMEFALANKKRFRLILESWVVGWDKANIAAPVPGWTEQENRKYQEFLANWKGI